MWWSPVTAEDTFGSGTQQNIYTVGGITVPLVFFVPSTQKQTIEYVQPTDTSSGSTSSAPASSTWQQPVLPSGAFSSDTLPSLQTSMTQLLESMQEVAPQSTSLIESIAPLLRGSVSTVGSLDRVVQFSPSREESDAESVAPTGVYPASLQSLCGSNGGNVFVRSLRSGFIGDEVRTVQQFLNATSETRVAETGGGSLGHETDVYGEKTVAAVRRFQKKYAALILAPLGLTEPTGEWGVRTRAQANALLCGAK